MPGDELARQRMAELVREATGRDLEPWQWMVLDKMFEPGPAELAPFMPGRATASLQRRDVMIRVNGRPAPQGSKRTGPAGQMIEQSPYLIGWAGGWKGGKARGKRIHGAVEVATYSMYASCGIDPASLPYLRGPVGCEITFYIDPAHGAIDKPPDIDKLARATFDALTAARLWEDDARVIDCHLREQPAMMPLAFESGALIRAWEIGS